MAELDDRKAAAAVRGPPLARQAIGLVPSDPQQNSGFLDGQEIRQTSSRHPFNA
jgi:hypothetical protein